MRRVEIEKKEEQLLEQRVKEIETEMRHLGATQKEVQELHNEEVQAFFRKARRWRSEKFEKDLLQKIEKEDIKLNEELCGERMRISNGMDKIWERYDQDFLNQPQNRIYCLDKAIFEKWAEETGYTYTPIRVPPSKSLLDKYYQQRKEAKELFWVSEKDETQYVKDTALLHRIKMREREQISLENLTEEEEISSSKSDP